MSNIVNAVFDGSRRKAITCPLFQYDYGQIMKISGIELPASYQVQFSNTEDAGVSKTMLGDADGVQIPDEYLLTGDYIYAFVYLHETEDDGETEYVIEIPVIRRPVPSEETPTPAEQSLIGQLLEQLNQGVEAAEAAADQAGAAAETAVAGMIDDTLTIQGKAADAKKTGDELTQLKSEIEDLDGLSDDVKTALLACFRNVAWTTDRSNTLYNNLYKALYPEAQVESIAAIFNQGTAVIYPDTSLDDIKQYLTVTAYYGDGTSAVVYDYELSGELSAGVSEITVTYLGKTAKFNATVTSERRAELPSGYDQVEYIYDPNRKKYIVTDVMSQIPLRLDARVSFTGNSTLASAGDSSTDRFILLIRSKMYYLTFGQRYTEDDYFTLPVDTPNNEVLEVISEISELSSSNMRMRLNWNGHNTTGTTPIPNSMGYPINIQRMARDGYVSSSNSKIYSYKLSSGETTLFDGIPSIRKSDGATGLYDVVSGNFYTGAGDGSYSVGAIVR